MKEVTFAALMRNKTIKKFLIDKLGEDGVVLIEILFKAGRYVSEFTLAERSAIYVNTVRSLLYRLYDAQIVNYSRKREKTRGWYIYSWRFNPLKLINHLIKQLTSEKKKLKKQLSEQSNEDYFYCKDCNIKLTFTEAMEYNFACPNCFKPMELMSPKKESDEIKKKIEELKDEIKSLERLGKRIEDMQKAKEEEERKKKEKEEAEKKALAEKGMYFCTRCNKPHKIDSKIGIKHKDYAK